MSGALADPAAAPQVPDDRPLVNSFDVFDTLIARRCIEPGRIFDAMESALGMQGFALHRRQAEAALAGGETTLHAIHAELARRMNLEPACAARLLQAEIQAELDHVIPIAANMAGVENGDILISDMYLSEAVIRALLAKAGLDRLCGLVVSADGKHSGRIWPELQSRLRIARHVGDNPHADIASPARFGIAAAHTTRAAPDLIETWLIDRGLRDIAENVRQVRLACNEADALTERLRWVQTHLNFPILALASIRLARLANRIGSSHLLFSSRDCNLWLPLYSLLAPRLNGPPARYFYTNRRTRFHPSGDYLTYAAHELGDAGMVVDLCGTGWSLAHLMQRLGQGFRDVFLLHRMAALPAYERMRKAPESCRFHAIVAPDCDDVRNDLLEMCNYAAHGPVLDVCRVGPGFVPMLAQDETPPALLEKIRSQRSGFTAAIAAFAARPSIESCDIDDSTIDACVLALYRVISAESSLPAVYGAAHGANDLAVMLRLELGT